MSRLWPFRPRLTPPDPDPMAALLTKWIPPDKLEEIRGCQRESTQTTFRRADIEVMLIGNEYKAHMICNFGPRVINTWLLPPILDPTSDWQELAELAAWLVGITDQQERQKLFKAVEGLGIEHYLLVQVDGVITYKRLPAFQVETISRVQF